MTKNKSIVKNKASNDKVFKLIMDKLATLNQQNENKGQVKSVKDGVAQIAGLRSVKVGEIIEGNDLIIAHYYVYFCKNL